MTFVGRWRDAEIATLRDQLEASKANDCTAMMYLSEMKIAAGHDGDFPSLVAKVAALRKAIEDAAFFATHGECAHVILICDEALAATKPKP